MEKETNKEPKESKVSLSEQIDKQIESILEKGINTDNITYLGKLIDINKDCENIKYWKEKISMYGNYGRNSYGEYSEGGSYGRRGVPGTGRGRYRDGDSYGRRGVPGTGRGRYRGEEMLEEMMEEYGNYTEGREMYGADQDTLKSFKYMLKSFKDYYKHLKEEASSQEEIQLLEQTAREMLEI